MIGNHLSCLHVSRAGRPSMWKTSRNRGRGAVVSFDGMRSVSAATPPRCTRGRDARSTLSSRLRVGEEVAGGRIQKDRVLRNAMPASVASSSGRSDVAGARTRLPRGGEPTCQRFTNHGCRAYKADPRGQSAARVADLNSEPGDRRFTFSRRIEQESGDQEVFFTRRNWRNCDARCEQGVRTSGEYRLQRLPAFGGCREAAHAVGVAA